MRPGESFVSMPVRSLQTMLRVISKAENRTMNVVPDGIYGRQTAAAVSSYQREHGIPATGVTDQATWDHIVRKYGNAVTNIGKAQGIEVILNPNRSFCSGDSGPWIGLAQSMLETIQKQFGMDGTVCHSGCMDPETCGCVEAFQKLNDLPSTGKIDRKTWKHLSLIFSLAANCARTG